MAEQVATDAQAPRLPKPALGGTAADAAGEFAAKLGTRRRDAGAPIRNLFVADDRPDSKPTMAKLLSSGPTGGGGRGGQLRLKLYLSLLWVCAASPYEAVRPARAWAALLGLEDPEGHGSRRIQETLRELQERKLVRLRNRGGSPTGVTVLVEWGDGQGYEPPSETYNRFKQAGHQSQSWEMAVHRYFRVPSSLWTDGLIAKLNGPALAMLLILRCEQQSKDGTPVWFSPDRAATRFGLSESTRRLGLQKLRELGLVVTTTMNLSESGDFIDLVRKRKVHTLHLTQQPPKPTRTDFFEVNTVPATPA